MGLNSEEFGELIGQRAGTDPVSRNTISRWNKGENIQSKAHGNAVRALLNENPTEDPIDLDRQRDEKIEKIRGALPYLDWAAICRLQEMAEGELFRVLSAQRES